MTQEVSGSEKVEPLTEELEENPHRITTVYAFGKGAFDGGVIEDLNYAPPIRETGMMRRIRSLLWAYAKWPLITVGIVAAIPIVLCLLAMLAIVFTVWNLLERLGALLQRWWHLTREQRGLLRALERCAMAHSKVLQRLDDALLFSSPLDGMVQQGSFALRRENGEADLNKQFRAVMNARENCIHAGVPGCFVEPIWQGALRDHELGSGS